MAFIILTSDSVKAIDYHSQDINHVYFGSQNHPPYKDRIVQYVPQILLHHPPHSTQNKRIPLKSHNALPTCPSQQR